MKIKYSLLISATVGASFFLAPSSFAKTAKDCTAEWRADKAGMQARGVTEKSYVDQCKGDDAPKATPPATPSVSVPPVLPKDARSSSAGKTAKDCTSEWRADKAGMQARGVTEKAFVDQCKGGGLTPTASAPNKPTPSAAAPVSTPSTSSSQKTAKDCTAEWRADKAGMQARGTTEKAYVESCKNGDAVPTATAPKPKTTAAPAPAPKPAAPASTQAAPAPQKQTPVPSPSSAKTDGPTLEAGQFASEAPAKSRCPTDTVVWVNLKSKVYHFAGAKSYGTTERGAYMCEKDALAGEDRAAKNEKHP